MVAPHSTPHAHLYSFSGPSLHKEGTLIILGYSNDDGLTPFMYFVTDSLVPKTIAAGEAQ